VVAGPAANAFQRTYRWRRCVCQLLLIMFLALFGLESRLAAQQAVIEQIQFSGNRRIPRETLRGRIFLKEGDPYDEEMLRRDFHALWNMNYFDDIRLEVEEGEKGKIVIFTVVERPVIRRIEYKGNKSVSESDILDRFKERKVGLTVESQYDRTRVRRAEVVLRDLLGEHGRQFAEVRAVAERISASAIKLTFQVNEGPKVKVGKIQFQGNTVFGRRRLVRAMKHSRPYGLPPWFYFFSKTYHRGKLEEDFERLRALYQDHGYFRVLVKEPDTRIVDVKRGGIPGPWPLVGKKSGKRIEVTIPLEENARYRMGTIGVRGVEGKKLFFKTEFLKSIFALKEGDIFNVSKIRKALEDYRKLYGEFGFVNFTAIPQTDIDEENKRINVVLEMDEEKQFFVNRIEFVGNTTTRDKVIRREVLLDEGDLFNSRLWEMSLLRLNQLNYFEELKPEAADIHQNPKEGSVDITLKVKEKGKNSIGLSGGVSGIAGSFIGFSYTTNNFLGLGETLTFEADFGDRQKNFLFGFTEPYLRDRPIATGFTLFFRRFRFDQAREASLFAGTNLRPFIDPNSIQNFKQDSKGFTVFASYPLRRWSFTRIGITYGYDISDITAISDFSRILFEQLRFRSLVGPSAVEGIRSSKIIPTLIYNTTNHPISPTTGKSLFVSVRYEGGILGGNVNTFQPVVEFKYFRPVNRGRNVLAFRLLSAFATGFGGRVVSPLSRFYVGGEDNLRGFDIRAVSPFAIVPQGVSIPVSFAFQQPSTTAPLPVGCNRFGFSATVICGAQAPVLAFTAGFPGGDLQSIANFEYRIPIAGPVSLSYFFDAGINSVLRRSQLQITREQAEQLGKQFGTTVPTQLRLVPGTNFKVRASTGLELVVNLPIFNVPFRLYYAYNPLRLDTNVFGGAPVLDSTFPGLDRSQFPPGVFNNVVMPQIMNQLELQLSRISRPLRIPEPSRTFRFTISRTF